MIGTVFFWLMYLIVGLSVYTILRCSYKRIIINYNYNTKYEETNERYKHPLWFILLLILIFIIPILNISIPIIMFMMYYIDDDRNYYYKSFLTKKY